MDNLGIFYCSLCVEYTKEIEHVPSEKILGLDYSSHDFYYSSEGKTANYPRYYRKSEEKLKKEQRKLSRKVLKSNNWKKQKRKVAKLQKHIANQRLDWLHKESRFIADQYDVIVVENLSISRENGSMLRGDKRLKYKRKSNRETMSLSWYRFREI